MEFVIHTKRFVRAGLVLGAVSLALSIAAGAALAGSPLSGMVRSALTVKAPDKVVLIGIANAGPRLVAVGEHGVIITSDDNGRSWTQSAVPVDLTLTAVAFATPEIGWAVGHEGIILKTSDGGKTWTTQLNGIQVNKQTFATAQAAAADNDTSPGAPKALMRAQHFLDTGPENPFLTLLVTGPENALVFGAYRMVEKTTDGGKTWMDWDLHVGDPLSHNLYDAAMVGSDIYVSGEAGAVFRSTDLGNSFPIVSPPADTTMFEVLPTGDGGVLVCGVAGQAFTTADHGSTWKAVNLPTQTNLTAATVLSSGVIAVGDETGGLYLSADHGKSFSALPTVQPMGIFGLTQAANGDLVAVGNAGVIVIPAKDFLQS